MEVAAALFGAGFDHATTVPNRREDPPVFGGKGFRRFLELGDADPLTMERTEVLVRRGLARYAALVGEQPERMWAAVRVALDERADELARDVRRLEGEVAAVVARLDGGKGRQKAEELLPGGGRDERVAKYERHLHNLLTSTLHELERLQARRGGEAVPPPAVADVNGTIDLGVG